MKQLCTILLVCLLSIMASTSGQPQSADARTFSGEVIDSICAPYKSHQHMMEQMKSMGSDKKTCIQKCLQLGGKYVLFNMNEGSVYEIANPDKVEPFAGQQVQVKGTLRKKKITIVDITQQD